ncbi:SDA1-domain-containing protein [Xylona heveae TC161]|uniref:Protein SDA1 n=1 Tax=Xylona heveae (strain CBS 132557 / TC161) TaxID=1328760 RepID=A0A165HXF8_XYLHT|nr:SDA1-domain-containing protein [Xylona heveae TC161]KZF24062.1 SDA1-domain-containing protein [Xylona heveae TC161]
MGKRKVGALEKVEADLPNLQHKIRRDPVSYKDDFASQYHQYESHREIFMRAPGSATDAGLISLRELIDFVAHVADCYPEITKSFPEDLMNLITLHHTDLEPELREKIVGSLVLLRKKDVIDSSALLQTLFPLLTTTPSKSLRALLFQKILSDLRSSNAKTKNHRLNRTIQTVLFNLVVSDRTSSKGLWAVKLTRELWKRQIWTDSKTVEIMKEASLSDNEKVILGGVRFFLGGDKEREELAEEESDDEPDIDMGKLRHQAGINKKTRKQSKSLEKAAATVKRRERKKNQPHPLNFSALHLLHDPQGFAETLFQKHLQNTKSKLNLEQKLLVLQLVSRLVGLHRLTVISLYSYFLKYLTPRQPSVTSFLASLAQSTHSLVPPDVLEPLIQKIANEFVSEAAAAEVASAGLNAIREICVRQPLAMNETLLQDLVMYKSSKDKGVMMAAKGLLSLYREVGADLLRKKDRGKAATMELKLGERKQRRFGEEDIGGIEGLELLEAYKEEERKRKREAKGLPADAGADGEGNGDGDEEEEEDEDEDDWGAWNIEDEEDSDDSGGWINVESDGEIDISDSDSDRETKPSAAKKAKLDKKANPAARDVDVDGAAAEEEEENADAEAEAEAARQRVLNLATTRILTPADLAKLQELRTQASVSKLLPETQRRLHAAAKIQAAAAASHNRHVDDPLTAAEIEGLAMLSHKQDKESRDAAVKAAKGERNEHKSSAALRKEKLRSQGKSTTNKEKARKKNFLMTLGKARFKQKRSLVETQKVLKGHVERSKRGGRRGNNG